MQYFLIDDSENSIARITAAEIEGYDTRAMIQEIDLFGEKPADLSTKEPEEVKRAMIGKGYREIDGERYFEKAREYFESRLRAIDGQLQAYLNNQGQTKHHVFSVAEIMNAA